MVVGCGGSDGGPSYATEHPRIFIKANRDRLNADLAAQTPAAMRFKSTVDRFVGGSEIWGFQAWNAALLGQLSGDPKYCAAAVAAIDAQVREAEQAIASGDSPAVASDSYLGIGDAVGDLALVYDWCYEAVGERRGAWLAYGQQAVSNVWDHERATWGGRSDPWSGWATDDPSNNYYSSFLRATMLFGLASHGEVTGAGDWLVEFHDAQLLGQLVPTFESDLQGGGSREGTGYGVSMRRLFELYDLWQDSTGESIATLTGHTRASLPALMHATVPTLDRIAPTGDQARDSKAELFDFHRAYLLQLIALFPDDPIAPRAQALLDASSVPKMAEGFMVAYDFLYPGVAPSTLEGLGTAYHAAGTGQLYARSGWDEGATWVNLIAGPYTQSHAHQDQGALMIYKGGWLAYDANVESRSGLHQEVDAHGLVRISDGGQSIKQRAGTTSKLVALHRGDGWLHAAADLTPAYKGNAKVQQIQRELVFIEPDAFVIYDRVTTSAGTQQIWQLATPVSPTVAGTHATIAGAQTLHVERVQPAAATFAVTPFNTIDSDFSNGFRLDSTAAGGDQRFLHALWIGNAVTSVTPETDGVTLAVAGGTATVRFHRDAIGGTLTLGGSTKTLGPGVDPLPE